MPLFSLNSITRNNDTKRRLGRGAGSGRGKTAGRGTKGQKSRTGFNIPNRFEGGQSTIITRLPKKKGFRSTRPQVLAVSTARLSVFKAGELVSPKSLFEKGIITVKVSRIKLIGHTNNTKDLTYRNIIFSKPVHLALAKTKTK